MDTGTKSIVACFVLTISMLLFFASCGKRTTHTTRTNIRNDSLQISQSIELKQNATFSDIGTVRPFDASKPMLWNGAWHYNVVLEFDRSITSKSVLKGNENLSYNGSEFNTSQRVTEKTDRSNVWIGLSLVIGTLFVLYLTLKKYIP
jgi:hypothetical protein